MRLWCNAEIYDRTLSVSLLKRSQSILALGKKSIKDTNMYLYLQTRQNKQNIKYQIVNIELIFMRFVADGKVTIRMKQPCHDLIIQSDAIQLKGFLHILNCAKNGRYYTQNILTSKVSFNANELGIKKKFVVKINSDYPTLQGFPKTTEHLVLSGLCRKSFDRQILRLQSLKILDLSDNKISYLPKEIGTLPHLQQLLLSQNNLGKSPRSKWTWLEQTAIKNNLQYLDISSNSLLELPVQIKNLSALLHLNASQNALEYLPYNIKNLRNLKVLDVAKNHLKYLPATITYLKLELLNITENAFISNITNYIYNNNNNTSIRVPSLIESSAKRILKFSLPYDASTIPYTLVEYLDEAKCCYLCRSVQFRNYIKKLIHLSLKCSVRMSVSTSYVFESYFCSLSCANKFS